MEWIPVTERLPEIDEDILFTVYWPPIDGYKASYEIVLGFRKSENSCCGICVTGDTWNEVDFFPEDPNEVRVIAWIPVEPYKFKEG